MKPPRVSSATADALETLLPQTQCRQCGYPGCRPYAEALVTGNTPTDRCKPGGIPVLLALNALLAPSSQNTTTPSVNLTESTLPLSDSVSITAHNFPLQPTTPLRPVAEVAWIDESQCIGCALCIAVCPVDAIIGAPQLMHTIITMDCTGCGLCVAPCPVECIHIQLHPSPDVLSGYSVAPERSKNAFLRQQARRTPEQHQKAERLLALYQPVQTVAIATPPKVPQAERNALIDQLRARAKQRRQQD